MAAIEAAPFVLLQDSSLYKAAAGRLYPMVSGVADPAIERIANSAYTKAVVDHLKPVPKARNGEEASETLSCPC